MSIESLRDVTGMLRDLPTGALEFLESLAVEIEFGPGALIFDEDDAADSFYIVATGKVGLEVSMPARDPVLIQTLGPGELLGVSWLFPPHRWAWSARALEPTMVVAFDARAVMDECDRDVQLAVHVYRAVAEMSVRRLHATRVRLLDLYPGWQA